MTVRGAKVAKVSSEIHIQKRQALAILRGAADAGVPCPTNAFIGQTLGYQPQRVDYLIRRLAADGVISIENLTRSRRRVTICSTGAVTDWTPACNGATGTQCTVAVAETDDVAPIAETGAETPSIADQVKAEAKQAGVRRQLARTIGSVSSGAKLSLGGQMQMDQLSDGPGAGRAMLRERWPETHELLGRMAAQLGERPLPLLVRLINDEAARHGLRRAGDA